MKTVSRNTPTIVILALVLLTGVLDVKWARAAEAASKADNIDSQLRAVISKYVSHPAEVEKLMPKARAVRRQTVDKLQVFTDAWFIGKLDSMVASYVGRGMPAPAVIHIALDSLVATAAVLSARRGQQSGRSDERQPHNKVGRSEANGGSIARRERASVKKGARRGRPRKGLTLDLGKGVTMKLVLIPAGTFLMGSPVTEMGRKKNEGPQHQMTISKPFYMGTTEVTQAQWKAMMGTEPWDGKVYDAVKSGSNAASYIRWDDASKFCEMLSKKIGKKVALPSETQWEYACRAGSKTAYSFGDESSKLGTYAWYDNNASKQDERYAHPVGVKKSNAWGLYDMHGNVWEWCANGYASYANVKRVDLKDLATGKYRVLRGGSWWSGSPDCRAAYRRRCITDPGIYASLVGFRVVVASAKPKSTPVRTATGQPTKGVDKSKPAAMPLQLKRGLILHYDFDKNAGGTVIDRSGKRHHATVHGARWVKNARGLQNGAYQFDGKSKLDIGDIMNDAKLPITVSLWLRPDAFPPKGEQGAYPFCSDRWDSKMYAGFHMSINAQGRLGIAWGSSKGGGGAKHRRNLGRGIDVTRNRWVHVVGVMDKNRTLTLYVGGKTMRSSEIGEAASIGHTSASGSIGLRFSGMIDEPAVWNRALSRIEVEQLYNHTRGTNK